MRPSSKTATPPTRRKRRLDPAGGASAGTRRRRSSVRPDVRSTSSVTSRWPASARRTRCRPAVSPLRTRASPLRIGGADQLVVHVDAGARRLGDDFEHGRGHPAGAVTRGEGAASRRDGSERVSVGRSSGSGRGWRRRLRLHDGRGNGRRRRLRGHGRGGRPERVGGAAAGVAAAAASASTWAASRRLSSAGSRAHVSDRLSADRAPARSCSLT